MATKSEAEPTVNPVAKADDSKSPEGIVRDNAVETAVLESDSGQGALRLLQSGHFQGVADLRLRINFHQELAMRQEQAVTRVVEQHMSLAITTVSTQVDGLMGSGDLTEVQTDSVYEVLMIFQSSMTVTATGGSAVSTLSAQRPTGESFISQMQSAFNSLWDSLETLLNQGAVTDPGLGTPTDPVALADLSASSLSLSATTTKISFEYTSTTVEIVTADETPDFQAFMDTLQQSFASLIADMTAAIASVSILPALSEPTGNGVAYDKFLATLNDLWSTGDSEPVPENDPINLTV